MIAEVLVESPVNKRDKLFSYKIPDTLNIIVGIRVIVPFNTKQIVGFVMNIKQQEETKYELKEIIDIIDETKVLNDEMMKMGKWMSNNYLCSEIACFQAMLPKALKAGTNKIKIKEVEYITLNKPDEYIIDYISKCKYQNQIDILSALLEEKILKKPSNINTLLKKNLVKIETKETYRINNNSIFKEKKELTEAQKEVVEKINTLDNIILLRGVTGSGKTEVYMELIERCINESKRALMLVPEISLTSQLISRFRNRFDNIAIFHSKLNDGERYDEYRKVMRNEVDIVIGTRSAIFMPLSNIGIIILDEEHENSYKQENNPKYNTIDIAGIRAKHHNCKVLLGSATPSLESYARAKTNKYSLVELEERANRKSLPKVTIVDMKKEARNGNLFISDVLKHKIQQRLDSNEQVMLLLNKRGYSSYVMCRSCGYIYKCPNCDISMTLHKNDNKTKCHYCEYSIDNPVNCIKCGSTYLDKYGIGTEKLEEELSKLFNARIIRMDYDTTSKKNAHERIITSFNNKEYDILIGTQMIAKGLDFPSVTLVGVINADMSLNIPDFRSGEKTFQLLTQVSGRSGRGEKEGEVVIQTYNKDHYVISLASNHDYKSFYNKEMLIRKQLNYPPFTFLSVIRISTKDYDLGIGEMTKIANVLRKNLSSCTVLGPSNASISKINNIYRIQCIIKYKNSSILKEELEKIKDIYDAKSNVSLDIDFNAINI